jgi:tetratricopeptide (TPR) repeat protein
MKRMQLCSMVMMMAVLGPPLSAPSPALAQDASARDRVRRAIDRFEAALAASDPDERRRELEAALAELEEANRLDAEVLLEWNLARVELELGDVVAALEHVERFLAGAPEGAPRRSEAEAMRIALQARVGFLSVSTPVEGARVSVDGEPRGTTPLPEIRVASGAITVEVAAPSYRTETRRLRVASQEHARLSIDLERDRGMVGELRIRSRLLDVQVTIDDAVLGSTPLATTAALAPGPHTLIAERPGYRTIRRTIEVEVGSEQTIDLDLEIDPDAAMGALVLRVPDVPGRLTIDGQDGDLDASLELPEGRHAIELDLEERQDWAGELTILPGSPTELAPELLWQDAVLSRMHDNAEVQRITGLVVMGIGIAAVAVGVGVAVHGYTAVADAARDADRQLMACTAAPGSCSLREMMQLMSDRDYFDALSPVQGGIGIAVAILGAVAIPIGTWLFLDASSDDAIRRRASASLRLGAGTLVMDGTF